MIVLCAHRLYTPQEEIHDPLLLIEDGFISPFPRALKRRFRTTQRWSILPNDVPDAILVPGFVDIHMHGGAGIDVMRVSPAELPHLNRFLTTHGVTGYFPTTVAAPLDQTCAALERMADAIERRCCCGQWRYRAGSSARHPSGRSVSQPQAPRCASPENLVEPTLATFERLWQAARGQVRMMTIAPELPGALEVIAEAARRKICVSIGHSDAELEAARAAVRAGARHATHTFNAMRPLDHRDPGILAEVLTDEPPHRRHHCGWNSRCS